MNAILEALLGAAIATFACCAAFAFPVGLICFLEFVGFSAVVSVLITLPLGLFVGLFIFFYMESRW